MAARPRRGRRRSLAASADPFFVCFCFPLFQSPNPFLRPFHPHSTTPQKTHKTRLALCFFFAHPPISFRLFRAPRRAHTPKKNHLPDDSQPRPLPFPLRFAPLLPLRSIYLKTTIFCFWNPPCSMKKSRCLGVSAGRKQRARSKAAALLLDFVTHTTPHNKQTPPRCNIAQGPLLSRSPHSRTRDTS